jgi:hypothetical protein
VYPALQIGREGRGMTIQRGVGELGPEAAESTPRAVPCAALGDQGNQ